MPATTDRKYNGERVSQRVERVAAGVLDIWERSPRLGYGEAKKRVMAKFACGHRTAEAAMKIAATAIAATLPDKRERVEAALWSVYEEERAKGNGIAAVRAVHEIARIGGMHAPLKLEHSGTVARLDLANLSDEELEEELARVAAIEKRVAERDE
jgi:hypothetical protein